MCKSLMFKIYALFSKFLGLLKMTWDERVGLCDGACKTSVGLPPPVWDLQKGHSWVCGPGNASPTSKSMEDPSKGQSSKERLCEELENMSESESFF